ncbi:MAG: HD domain-containing protein, partial [Candidatus Eremiobacteraeota bacterium]|nr:HD domain-containing protein [Candidatus Eremiobacteraeota bacterium]
LTLMAVEMEVTFVNARLQRNGPPRIDASKMLPVEHVVDALVAVLRTSSDTLYQNARGVSALCGRIGGAMKMTSEQVLVLERCGLLHGIGKIGIPDHILEKTDALSSEEWALVRRYPAMGASILRTMPALAAYAPVIRSHRERMDGRGYPDGAGAHDIPLQAKIVGVADAFYAMIHDRPYRAALPAVQALESLQQGAGTEFDADVVQTLKCLIQPSLKIESYFQAAYTS